MRDIAFSPLPRAALSFSIGSGERLRMGPGAFHGKVALITGAAAGIGRAIPKEWVDLGGTALLTDVDGAAVANAATEVGGNTGRASSQKVDVKYVDEIREAIT